LAILLFLQLSSTDSFQINAINKLKPIKQQQQQQNERSIVLLLFCALAKDTHGTNTLAKDTYKQRTHSEKAYTAPLFWLLDCREATKYREQVMFRKVVP